MEQSANDQAVGRFFHLNEKLEPEIFFQLAKVLRVKTGDEVVLLADDYGAEFAGGRKFYEFNYFVQEAQKQQLVLKFKNILENHNELPFSLGLILCLPNKPDKLEFILQKAVELGVSKITLVNADFSQMKHNLRVDRLQKIITEAAEQSERAAIPKLIFSSNGVAQKLSDYIVSRLSPSLDLKEKTFVALERNNQTVPIEKLKEILRKNHGAEILVGPEGGFSAEEKHLFQKNNFPCFSLGKRILRMETAAILSLGLFGLDEVA